MATDIKEYFPSKQVTLVHSRDKLMPRFHPRLHEIIMSRAKELDIEVVLEQRVRIPEGGFPDGADGSSFDVELANRRIIKTDLAVSLESSSISSSRNSVCPGLALTRGCSLGPTDSMHRTDTPLLPTRLSLPQLHLSQLQLHPR